MGIPNFMFGGLIVILMAGLSYLIYIFEHSQYAGYYFFLFMAVAVLGLAIAFAVKHGDFVFLGLGMIFFAQGFAVLVSYWEQGADALDFLIGLSVLGIPFGILCVSIFLLWRFQIDASRGAGVIQYMTCVFIHLVNFFVSMLPQWSELTRFGGAAIALVFSLINFIWFARVRRKYVLS